MFAKDISIALEKKKASLGWYGALVLKELALVNRLAVADFVVLTENESHGIEIKTSRDDLRRLSKQCMAYSRVFKKVSVLCESTHLNKVVDTLPKWVGIILVDQRGFTVFKEAQSSPFFELELSRSLLEKRGVFGPRPR